MKTYTVLKWTLVVGIMIVLNLFFNYAAALAYPEPEYNNFCKPEQVNIQPKTKEECVAKGGAWTEGEYPVDNVSGQVQPMPVTKTVSSCNPYFTCQKQYEDATKVYNRNIFVILVVLGVISLGVSYSLMATPAVSLGLALGGVLSLIIASIRYWSNMEGYLRVIVLGLALIALIWLGIKKIKED